MNGILLINIEGVGLVSKIFSDRRKAFFNACIDPQTNKERRLAAARRWYDSVNLTTPGEMSEFCRQVDKLSQANQTTSWTS